MDSKASFHVVSNDAGFDPLVEHLNKTAVQASRAKEISGIPVLSAGKHNPPTDKIEAIAENRRAMAQSRARRVKTLRHHINILYGGSLTESELNELVKRLKEAGDATVEGGRVSCS